MFEFNSGSGFHCHRFPTAATGSLLMGTRNTFVDRSTDIGSAGRPTVRLHAVPDVAPRPPRSALRTVLGRYMVLAVILLGLVLLVDPRGAEVSGRSATQPWRYQREAVNVDGGGPLNAYGRVTIQFTAWVARGAIERLRDVTRLNLLDLLVGSPTARSVGGWRESNGLALQRTTNLAVLALVLVGVLARPSGRGWILSILLLLSLTLVVTRPVTTVRYASAPSVAIPNAVVDLVGRIDPHERLPAEQELATAYWDSFVANPLSRMQTGSPVLSGAPPESKAGALTALRHNITAVNDWAVGRRGWERAFIGSTALAYVLPFSVAIAAFSMVSSSAQALLFLLCLASLVAVPLGIERRRRPLVFRYWLLPLVGTLALLAVSALFAVAAMRLGQAVHRSDEYVGLLLAGSTWPIVLALVARRVIRRRRARPRLRATEGSVS
jgi:hypothetical protein